MCSAPIGSIPPPIDMDELGIGSELDISGIGDFVRVAAAEVLPELPQAAAASATAATPTPALEAEPDRRRPGDAYLDMSRPPQVPVPLTGTVTDGSKDASYRRRRGGVDCASGQRSGKKRSGGQPLAGPPAG